MSNKFKRLTVLLLMLIMVMSILPPAAFAAGFIDLTQKIGLNIDFKDDGVPIAACEFRLFKVADVDRYGVLTLCGGFEKHQKDIEYGTDTESWDALASTLEGYVNADSIKELKTGRTDDKGFMSFGRDNEPGLYLVLGSSVKIDHVLYTAVPFMVFLPAKDPITKDWTYDDVTVTPKKLKEVVTEELELLKIWDDKGYETNRPESVEVQLFCDGEKYGDPITLSKDNDWKETVEVSIGHHWSVVEIMVPTHYRVRVSPVGAKFTITNKYVPPVIGVDPPVQKKIEGETPASASAFVFTLTAGDDSFPMPAGSDGRTKTISIIGAGSREFGYITFTEPGTYTYFIHEINNGILGYTYDTQTYTLTFTVTEAEDGTLKVTKTELVNGKGEPANAAVFTNYYKNPGQKLPQTGQLWWPVPILAVLGAAFLAVGIIRRRRSAE